MHLLENKKRLKINELNSQIKKLFKNHLNNPKKQNDGIKAKVEINKIQTKAMQLVNEIDVSIDEETKEKSSGK